MTTIGSLFTGYGGLDMGVAMALDPDARVAWTSDVEPGPCKLAATRWPDTPNLGDITQINWDDVGPVDIICGGSPCQDLSLAGKRAGMASGTRSGLWESMAAAVETIRPRLVVWENVLGALSARAYSPVEQEPGMLELNQLDLISGLPDVWQETWPQSGIAVRGVLYALPTREPRTSEPDSSLLATPTANLGACGGPQDPEKRREGGHSVSL